MTGRSAYSHTKHRFSRRDFQRCNRSQQHPVKHQSQLKECSIEWRRYRPARPLLHRRIYFGTNYNPCPRFGFAWNPGGSKTVIRGGYGINYSFIYLNPITGPPPFMFTLPGTQVTGASSIANILAGTSPFQAMGHGASARSARPSRISATVTYIDPRLKSPQYQQFSLTIERELANRGVVRAGYSGPVIT